MTNEEIAEKVTKMWGKLYPTDVSTVSVQMPEGELTAAVHRYSRPPQAHLKLYTIGQHNEYMRFLGILGTNSQQVKHITYSDQLRGLEGGVMVLLHNWENTDIMRAERDLLGLIQSRRMLILRFE